MQRSSPQRSVKKHKHNKNRDRSRSPLNQHSNKGHDKKELSPEGTTRDFSDRSGVDVSLSVKETNALRAKIGLAPLETNDNCNIPDVIVDNQSQNYVHAPAKDIQKLKRDELIKEKLSVQKDKRKFNEKFDIEKLSASSEKYTDVQSWVEKMKEKEHNKKLASERAKFLSELDEQFDISHMVEAELKKQNISKYRSSDLAGFSVEHKVDRFVEGKSIILTIKDKDILDEAGGDVLVNVNLVDDEKADLNRENLRKIAGLAGIEDQEDEDILLGLREKPILNKYDEEIKGVQKSKFTIGKDGSYSMENERMLNELEAELKRGRQSLPDTELRLASEFYSPDEMKAKFKKRKRRVQTIRKIDYTEDDLFPSSSMEVKTDDVSLNSSDLGNRVSRRFKSSGTVHNQPSISLNNNTENILQAVENSENILNEDWSTVELDEPDEFRGEIENSISRIIQFKTLQIVKPEEFAFQLISRTAIKNEESELPNSQSSDTKKNIVFDSTAEFYKSIGVDFHESIQRNAQRHAQLDELDDEFGSVVHEDLETKIFHPEVTSNASDSEEDEHHPSVDTKSNSSKRWHSIEQDEDNSLSKSHNRSINGTEIDVKSGNIIQGVLDDEPRLDAGVYSALIYAEKKGYAEKSKEKQIVSGTMVNLMAKHFVQEEKRFDDIDAKFIKRDRFARALSSFSEMRHYKPEVKLEYVDDLGRDLNAKEAFRQLSHKFHGKGSGKNKIQKRMEKIKEEFLLKASTSSDTPLGTAEKLNKKLKSISLPYVILSGKNAAVLFGQVH